MVGTPDVGTQASVPHHCWHDEQKSLRIQGEPIGSWDLVTRVIIRVTILITTYNSNSGPWAILTTSHHPPSRP